jgi:3D-(3,5/4)-trihydroxycyclohexane-1,2-dione acylhydrolase (decyclizing)
LPAAACSIPVAVTQAGKSAIPDDHPLALGSIGVTGTSAANAFAEEADVILAVGTRMQDFTTGSWALFKNENVRIIGLNTAAFDAAKRDSLPLVADAREGLTLISDTLGGWKAPAAFTESAAARTDEWMSAASGATAATNAALPSDAQVIGAVQRAIGGENSVLVCAAGGLPGELHKLWQASRPGSYHMEYGFSCMGYEIAGGLGVKLARPEADVVVMVGDGSYMMMNSELSTSVMLGQKLTIVVLDNRGYGCINRLQMGTGSANFNNLLKDSDLKTMPEIDFRAHAESMGAVAVKVSSIADLEAAIEESKGNDRTSVIVIDTDPLITTEAGGHWWDVAVPEVSPRPEVNAAREAYEKALAAQRIG